MSNSLHVRKTILLPLRSAGAFLDIYLHEGECGGVLVPPTAQVKIGERVELEIVFAQEQLVFYTRGTARWRRPRAMPKLPAGTGVHLAEGEKRTRDLLLDFASGNRSDFIKRVARRFPVAIPVEYTANGQSFRHTTEDFSRTGCFIRTASPLPIGTRVRLSIRPPNMAAINAEAEVVRYQRCDPQGVGVRFIAMDSAAQVRVDQLIAQIKQLVVRNSA